MNEFLGIVFDPILKFFISDGAVIGLVLLVGWFVFKRDLVSIMRLGKADKELLMELLKSTNVLVQKNVTALEDYRLLAKKNYSMSQDIDDKINKISVHQRDEHINNERRHAEIQTKIIIMESKCSCKK